MKRREVEHFIEKKLDADFEKVREIFQFCLNESWTPYRKKNEELIMQDSRHITRVIKAALLECLEIMSGLHKENKSLFPLSLKASQEVFIQAFFGKNWKQLIAFGFPYLVDMILEFPDWKYRTADMGFLWDGISDFLYAPKEYL